MPTNSLFYSILFSYGEQLDTRRKKDFLAMLQSKLKRKNSEKGNFFSIHLKTILMPNVSENIFYVTAVLADGTS